MTKKNNMLIILDGLGIGKDYEGNAFYLGHTPTIDRILKDYPKTELVASGEGVGLPAGQMGNSEVGHLNIGAGRIIYQNLLKINNAIREGTIKQNLVLQDAMLKAKENNKALHLIGLLSQGGVHSHQDHLFALMEMAKANDLEKVYIHVILDGRDVSPHAGIDSIKDLEEKIKDLGLGKIASIAGRYYAMDRDKNWSRTLDAYKCIVEALGDKIPDPELYIKNSYAANITDEFIIPKTVAAYEGMEDGDSVIFYNFRPDRARQLTWSIVNEDFDGFLRDKKVYVNFVTMTEYDKTIKNVKIAFEDQIPKNTMGQYISSLGLKQLRLAETEKFAHVTYFFNGGREEPFDGEDRILVPSPKVATFDLQPQMSAKEVADKAVEAIDQEKYDLIVLNFANCDMVGHTGVIEAAVQAVQAVDFNLGRVLDKLKEKNGQALITADHGNCEMMLDDNKMPITSHTTNPVPLVLFNYGEDASLKAGGRLCDLSPTLLAMMDLDKPEEMTGHSLLDK
ncbi:MAG: 2,3-bisphosphoglycerate-independent phosphoglycerate mutase [Bacillota bacterium]|nr:2,3-bisphosphoglycerate-independent phosphoglycerate mutase [Bacillota bacterium]